MKKEKKGLVTYIVGSWVVIGVTFSALTFVYKMYEIISTVPKGDATGFAAVHVITYLLVAIGFFILFTWSFLKGDFNKLESSKYRVLEMEEKMCEIERRDGYV